MRKIIIGFITSPHMASYLQQIEKELLDYCHLIYIIIENPSESLAEYRKYKNKVDCFVFSGHIYYYAVSEHIKNPEIPGYIIDEFEGDIKELLLKELLKNRNIDLSRIYIDSALEVNNFLGLKDLLPAKSLPYFNNFKFTNIDKYLEEILKSHLNLHKSGKIDLSITRISDIATALDKKHLSNLYLYPVKEYLLNFFMQIIHSIGKEENDKNVFAAIAVGIDTNKSTDSEIAMSKCIRVFMNYAHEKEYDLVVQRNKGVLLLLSQYKDIKRMTNNLTSSNFKDEIEARLKETISIGIGMGYDMFQARRNSLKALDVSRRKKGSLYSITELNRLTGPLGSNEQMILKSYPSNKLILLSKEYHIDHINLQKIISFAKLNQSEPFTAYQLAEYLEVTVRSASRLINKIETFGGAESYLENSSSSRGRPKKYYNLTLAE